MTDKIPQKQGLNKDFIDNQWKPGESGNPGGKRVGESITAQLRKLLDEGNTAEDLARVLLALAKSGSKRGQLPALQEILNRSDGKVADTHKIEGDIPVSIKYVVKEK